MPAGAIESWSAASAYSFQLKIGGLTVTRKVPTGGIGVSEISFSESNESTTGQMTFSIEDLDSTFFPRFGDLVELTDERTTPKQTLFGGHLIEASVSNAPSNRGRIFTCTAIGFNAWLDWRIIPRFTSKPNVQGRINRMETDRAMVQALVNRFAPFINAPDGTVNVTNTNMPNVSIMGMTLREALEAVAEAATPGSDGSTRYFYVDDQRRLHWYKETENLTPPYHIAEGVYTREVLGTSGLTTFWSLDTYSGTTVKDIAGTSDATVVGNVDYRTTNAIPNEPQVLSMGFDGQVDGGGNLPYLTATGSSVHLGDTFSLEMWFKRTRSGVAETLFAGLTGEPRVHLSSADKLQITKVGTGTNYLSTDSIADTEWHHLLVVRSPGSTTVYLDGDTLAGTVTAQTFVASTGTVRLANNATNTEPFIGSIACVSFYSTALVEKTVYQHHTIGSSVVPEGFSLNLTAYDGREEVYIAGKNVNGSGWIQQRDWLNDTAFARIADWGRPAGQPARQEFLEREQSETAESRRNIGRAYLRRHTDPQVSGSFTVTGFDGWKVGQKIRIYYPSLDIQNTPDNGKGYPFEIRDVQTSVGMGNGVMTHRIDFGQARVRATRILARRRRR